MKGKRVPKPELPRSTPSHDQPLGSRALPQPDRMRLGIVVGEIEDQAIAPGFQDPGDFGDMAVEKVAAGSGEIREEVGGEDELEARAGETGQVAPGGLDEA